MSKTRLEAFSDGVIAILITIMVLEFKVPPGPDLPALRSMLPVFLSYVLSFVFLGIYWNNHHHMLHAAEKVDGRILWANLHLLFWLSLVPIGTEWIGNYPFARLPTAVYGVILLCAALAYTILQATIVRRHGPDSLLASAVGRDSKGKLSLGLYVAAIGAAFLLPWISYVLYILVALIWLVPDRRIEKKLHPS
ncbi:MAG TPA: TMEM175 family protein [Planctomycetota bacterium]|nr:TMEM175 family protein [Planctomycetota bacterium]